ncbi:MAG TPA: ATPase [Prolixibacteraceae bacterium]|nr:ATPase [Prolixibacteraceae bacterium]
MYLIAESGSTKTQWSLVDKDKILKLVNTSGINPLNLTPAEIQTYIRPLSNYVENQRIDAIYFFGAGCASPSAIRKIESALSETFNCEKIFVDSDLIAACLALAGTKKGIVGLLGTGSNSCVWDGVKVTVKIPSLGYVLGDEGGGVAIGKQLLTDYLKFQMPALIRDKFAEKYKISAEKVVERVYQMPMPNRYLAGFAPFAEANIDDTYCYNVVKSQFESFFAKNIFLYPDYQKKDLYFCGSIAHAHADILDSIVEENGLKIKKIVKEPIDGLAEYFQKLMG